jgi:hypothetical protein
MHVYYLAKTLPVTVLHVAHVEVVKVGNAASEIGGGVEPNNATSPMNEPLFGGS